MIFIRSGRGLGDSIYLRAIVGHLVAAGNRVVALSDYPDVFRGGGADVEPFTRSDNGRGVRVAHYTHTMHRTGTTQYEDMCYGAGIRESAPLRFDWHLQNRALIRGLLERAAGRRLIVVHGGRAPMQRDDGYGLEMVPRREAFEAALGALSDCFTVRIGNAPHLYPLPVDVDLQGTTSVADLLDIASVSDGVIAQCSFAVPLAECLGRPLLAIWGARGLVSPVPYVRLITPRKVLSATSRFVIDDWAEADIASAAVETFNLEPVCAL